MKRTKEVWQGNKEKHTSKNPLIRHVMNKYFNDLIKIISEIKPESLLDAGCGEGFVSARIKARLPNVNIEGIDLEDNYLDFAKSNFKNIKLIKASIYDIPKNDDSYDIVLCNEVLEHLDDPHKALRQLFRVSKKYVLVSVPNEPFFRIANILRLKYLKNLGNPPEHLNNWTKNDIIKLLSNYGTLDKSKTSTIWTFALLKKN